MDKSLRDYLSALFITLVSLLAVFFIIYTCFGKTEQSILLGVISIMGLGPLMGNFLFQTYNKPILRFDSNIQMVQFDYQQTMEPHGSVAIFASYKVGRIKVNNIGKNAASNCKAYLSVENNKVRVCWTIPSEQPNAIINRDDYEEIDFCAFDINPRRDRWPSIIAPTEDGWGETPDDSRNLADIVASKKLVKVIVTSDNADPIRATIKFHADTQSIEIIL